MSYVHCASLLKIAVKNDTLDLLSSPFSIMALVNKSVIEKLTSAGLNNTIEYLSNLPECDAQIVPSLRITLERLRGKFANLNKSAKRPSGREALDNFLSESFAFPKFDRKKHQAIR